MIGGFLNSLFLLIYSPVFLSIVKRWVLQTLTVTLFSAFLSFIWVYLNFHFHLPAVLFYCIFVYTFLKSYQGFYIIYTYIITVKWCFYFTRLSEILKYPFPLDHLFSPFTSVKYIHLELHKTALKCLLQESKHNLKNLRGESLLHTPIFLLITFFFPY